MIIFLPYFHISKRTIKTHFFCVIIQAMKKTKISLILFSLFLSSCNSIENQPLIEGNTISFSDAIDGNIFSFEKNNAVLSEQKEDNIKNYFLTHGSHMANDSDYIFLFKGKIDNRQYKLDISYNSQKVENPFYFAATYYQDKETDRPCRSYFSSFSYDFTGPLFSSLTCYYDYQYLESGEEKQISQKIEFSDLKITEQGNVQSVHFEITPREEEKGKQKEESLCLNSFYPLRALIKYASSLLNAISPSYRIN